MANGINLEKKLFASLNQKEDCIKCFHESHVSNAF